MKEWKILLSLEYEWRLFRMYRKIMNRMICKGISLSSPLLCLIKRKFDKHSDTLFDLQHYYEKQTGHIIVYYHYDEI